VVDKIGQALVAGLMRRAVGAAKASKHKRKLAESAAPEIGGIQATLIEVLQGHRQTPRSFMMPRTAAVFTVDVSRATGLVATGGADGAVRLWHAGSPEKNQILIETGGAIHSVRFSADGSMLAAGGNDREVHIWDLSEGSPVARQLPGTWRHKGIVTSLTWSADGRNIASACSSGHVTIGRPGSTEDLIITKVSANATGVEDVSFSPDGTRVAFAAGRTIALIKTPSGRQARTFPIGKNTANSVAYSPSGQLLAAGLGDGTVRVWRLTDGEQVYALHSHAPVAYVGSEPLGRVRGMAFSSNGLLLASGGWDGVVKIWRVHDGALLRNIVSERGLVHALAWSADGGQLALATNDGTAHLWSIR
jgi:WD40 repeat protein